MWTWTQEGVTKFKPCCWSVRKPPAHRSPKFWNVMYRDKATGWTAGVGIPAKTSAFLSTPKHAHRLLSHPACYSVCADVKNAWSYALLLICSLLAATGTSLRHFTFRLPFRASLSFQCPEVTDMHFRELRCVAKVTWLMIMNLLEVIRTARSKGLSHSAWKLCLVC